MILSVALFLSWKNSHNQKEEKEGTVAQIGDDAAVSTMAGYTNPWSGPTGRRQLHTIPSPIPELNPWLRHLLE